MIPQEKLDQILSRFGFVEARLNSGPDPAELADLSREYSDLKPVCDRIRTYRETLDGIDEAQALLSDPDMAELAREEVDALTARLPGLEPAATRRRFSQQN